MKLLEHLSEEDIRIDTSLCCSFINRIEIEDHEEMYFTLREMKGLLLTSILMKMLSPMWRCWKN